MNALETLFSPNIFKRMYALSIAACYIKAAFCQTVFQPT